MEDPHQYELKALTPIWTGDANREGNRLITTGLLGSIRWWFEVLVRGLGGSACDPTQDGNRCPGHRKKPTDPGHRCVVCEFFGCTGWARKFRFEVLENNGKVKSAQIKKDETFKLRFTPLRSVRPEEWALLDLTLRLIADYGAIGGKTILKPSDEASRANAAHHRDYGVIEILDPPSNLSACDPEQLESYIRQERWRKPGHDGFAWASLVNFWCVKGRYLARQDNSTSTFNKVIGRDERKLCMDCGGVHNPPQKCPKTQKHPRRWSDDNPSQQPDRWLAGRQQESKKVFSFKAPEPAQRTFSFVNPGQLTLKDMHERLKGAWPDLKDKEFVTGLDILQRLLSGSRESTA
jgi:CRISPR-associated protein Cmr1